MTKPSNDNQPKITFIGAGSTIFMKNIAGDVLHHKAVANAHIALMDIDPERLAESELVAKKMIASMGTSATVSTHSNQREALDGADFVVVCFQIGGYEPCTVTDFEIPKQYGLRQTTRGQLPSAIQQSNKLACAIRFKELLKSFLMILAYRWKKFVTNQQELITLRSIFSLKSEWTTERTAICTLIWLGDIMRDVSLNLRVIFRHTLQDVRTKCVMKCLLEWDIL